MLSSQLLRITISDRGKNIFPIFLSISKDLNLATELINVVELSIKNKEIRSAVRKKILELEKQFNVDRKLVQGLYELINRRCEYIEHNDILDDNSFTGNNLIKYKDPILIRRLVFEESSRYGLAITSDDRSKILEKIAAELKTSQEIIEKLLWIDLEDNQIIKSYDQITPEELIGWYNLSILQTIFFNCTSLEISIKGGTHWKKVLRFIKKFGLMYTLREISDDTKDEKLCVKKKNCDDIDVNFQTDDTNISCLIDGPLSIFKMNEKYGTSISKIIPSIVMLDRWKIDALILRKSFSSQKIYELHISSYDSILFMHPNSRMKKGVMKDLNKSLFDSKVEVIFAEKFESFNTGWKLIREPDPLILTDKRAFIPDFLILNYDMNIYIEIIGFWTEDYLKRKFNKITDILDQKNKKIEFFFLINQDLLLSKYPIKDTIKEIEKVSQHNFIFYKNNQINIKPIVDHLKSINEIMITKKTEVEKDKIIEIIEKRMNDLEIEIISLKEISKRYGFSIELINRSLDLYKKIWDQSFYKIDEYLISIKKLHLIKKQLRQIIKLEEALKIIKHSNIPETCSIQLIKILGYDILWNGIDVNNATISKIK